MKNQPLAVFLILQDMRHFQFIWALEDLNMDMENHYLDIGRAVAGIMGLPWRHIPSEWTDLYMSYMERVREYPITSMGENLRHLAEDCHKALLLPVFDVNPSEWEG